MHVSLHLIQDAAAVMRHTGWLSDARKNRQDSLFPRLPNDAQTRTVQARILCLLGADWMFM